MSVCLRTKWLGVRITLLLLKHQIWRLLHVRSSLTFRQTLDLGFTLKLVRGMIITYSHSFLCFRLALLHSMSYFFFLYRSPSALCTVFDSISSNIDEVLSINPSANVFVFRDFNVHHKDWFTHSQMTLLRC